MKIGGTNGVNGPQRIYPKQSTPQAGKAAETSPAGDSVEISPQARLSEAMASLPELRADKVAGAKKAIADGTLDTPENMDIAINRMMDDVAGFMELE